MSESNAPRPGLSSELTGAELQRWYWLKDELADFARLLGVRATGSKDLLTQRIAAALDGEVFAEPSSKPTAGGAQLSGPLTAETLIPRGQRCSQIVRAWFAEQTGGTFHFDAEMRAFFAGADGSQRLQDALEHWRATRGLGAKGIDPQFEYNRFTRAWYAAHPAASREALGAAWQEYRRRPVDERGRA